MTCKDWHTDQDWKLDQIDIAYVEPNDPAYSAIYDNLKKRQILEELQQFLSPVRLPEKGPGPDRTMQCAREPVSARRPRHHLLRIHRQIGSARHQDTGGRHHAARRLARRRHGRRHSFRPCCTRCRMWCSISRESPSGAARTTRPTSLPLSSCCNSPPKTARKLMNGAAFFFEASDRTWTGSDFADVKSTEAQRFYNYLCIAYGSDPESFADFVQRRRTTIKRRAAVRGRAGPAAAARACLGVRANIADLQVRLRHSSSSRVSISSARKGA